MSVGTAISDYSSALEFLLDRINYERTSHIPYRSGEFRLDRMGELLRRLGDPHLSVPAVHVTGTKGKGSTAAMIAAILQHSGYCTGLYTSPHLERIEERYAINGADCAPEELVRLAHEVEPVVRDMDEAALAVGQRGPTFFETTTAMAFMHFARRPVDVAVLEVGLGGRLDSTNVCRPSVCVITSISFDHTRQLGNTLAAIAAEKAGIIKPGIPVISGVVEPVPQSVIERIAREKNSPLLQLGREFDACRDSPPATSITFRATTDGPPHVFSGIELNLLGRHQVANAAVAIAAVQTLVRGGWNVPEAAIRQGLATVRCPARVEVVAQRPTIVVDSAHNVASVQALCETLPEVPGHGGRRVLMFATSRDKDAAGMLRRLVPQFDDVIVTRYVNNPRARAMDELLALARLACPPARLHESPEPLPALRLARELAGSDGLICITGSFFLAAELRAAAAERSA